METGDIPITFREKIGTMKVSRGTMNGEMLLYAWDVVQMCHPECRAQEYCSYVDRRYKCTVQYDYIKSFINVLFGNFREQIDEATMYQVGMHLIPMYRILCKMMIDELGFNTVMFPSPQAGWKVYPIYKEIRDQIKKIEETWKTLGLQAPPIAGSLSMKSADGKNNGSGKSYYEQMEAGDIRTFKQQVADQETEEPSDIISVKTVKKSRLKR